MGVCDRQRSPIRARVVAMVCLAAAGCASIGPGSIERDRFDYGEAIANSWEEQMLFNMVRLRYGEAPVFLEVVSVISQYTIEGELSGIGGVGTSIAADYSLLVNANAKWSDRPTITYVPLTGQQFTRDMLTPIPPHAIFAMIQAGWPVEQVLGLTLRSMNGVTVRELESPQMTPEFLAILDAVDRLQTDDALGLRREMSNGTTRAFLYFIPDELGPDGVEALAQLRQALRLDPIVNEYELVFGRISRNSNHLAVLSLSVLDILKDLSAFFDVPAVHVQEGRTAPTVAPLLEHGASTTPIRVRVSEEEPDDAFVAIFNRGHWFYIDDRDLASKNLFSLLMVLLNLAEAGETYAGPIVTVGAG